MAASFRIEVAGEDQVGAARRQAADFARSTGGDDVFSGRFSLLAVEAAQNLVRHGGGGEVVMRCLRREGRIGLELLALDRGPGMASVAECLRDGFSTGGTAGQGLGALRRQAELFEIYSRPGQGTAVWCQAWVPGPPGSPAVPPEHYRLGVVNVPIKGESECGDAWTVEETPGHLRVLLADGLGHGPQAAAASGAAVERLEAERARPLPAAVCGLHEALQATRGAALLLVEVQPTQVRACGVGNICGRIAGGPAPARHLLSTPGTAGVSVRSPQEFSYPWAPGQLLILHSDGLTASWRLEQYAGLEGRHPGLIAGVLYRDFQRGRDDATVLVLGSAKL